MPAMKKDWEVKHIGVWAAFSKTGEFFGAYRHTPDASQAAGEAGKVIAASLVPRLPGEPFWKDEA